MTIREVYENLKEISDYCKSRKGCNECDFKSKETGHCMMLEKQYRIDDSATLSTRDVVNVEDIEDMPSITPTGQWNNHQIACLLADLFGDTCACNYNGIDEWLPMVCDFKDTCCPKPVGVACWEQFLKHYQSRYTECGYEVR